MNLVLMLLLIVISFCNDEVNKGGFFILLRIVLYFFKDVDEFIEGFVGMVVDFVLVKVGNVLICWFYRIVELVGSFNF